MQIKRKERISSKIVPLTIYEKFISIELRSKLETVPCQIAIDHSLISQQVKNQRLARYTYALLQNLSSQVRYHDHVHSETPKILYIYTHMFYKNCNRDWSDNLDLVKHRNLCQINNKIDWRCDNFHENSFETLKIRMKCNTLLHTIFYTY